MYTMKRIGFVLVVLLSLFVHNSQSQGQLDSLNDTKNKAVKIFLDCNSCDHDFIRSEITFVNYVRDRNEADVHILVTTQRTGSGGREYTLTFIGRQNFAGINDTLVYNSKKADTEESIRNGITRSLKLGLIRYATKTPLADQLSVSYSALSKPTTVIDPWDYWVFSIGMHSFLNGEQSSKSKSIFGSLSANRVTSELKINLSVNADYSDNAFEYVIDGKTYTYLSVSRGQNFHGLAVKSIDDHWSFGGSSSVNTSTYSNTKLSLTAAPAIEFDLFPYSESTRRQLRFLYKAGFRHVDYEEETIYDKTTENLFNEVLTVSLDVKEQWGSTGVSLSGSHYFHDFDKYDIGIFGSLSLRLVEGLSLNIFGDFSKPHDQLSLPKGDISQQDVLLRRRELETQYRYSVSIGFSYTFGSIFNNIVNPRFGSGGGGFSFSFSN